MVDFSILFMELSKMLEKWMWFMVAVAILFAALFAVFYIAGIVKMKNDKKRFEEIMRKEEAVEAKKEERRQ